MLRNSTRQPMGEFGGGGLNLNVCQLVDWMFCETGQSICGPHKVKMEQTSKWSVLLLSSWSTSSEKITIGSRINRWAICLERSSSIPTTPQVNTVKENANMSMSGWAHHAGACDRIILGLSGEDYRCTRGGSSKCRRYTSPRYHNEI